MERSDWPYFLVAIIIIAIGAGLFFGGKYLGSRGAAEIGGETAPPPSSFYKGMYASCVQMLFDQQIPPSNGIPFCYKFVTHWAEQGWETQEFPGWDELRNSLGYDR